MKNTLKLMALTLIVSVLYGAGLVASCPAGQVCWFDGIEGTYRVMKPEKDGTYLRGYVGRGENAKVKCRNACIGYATRNEPNKPPTTPDALKWSGGVITGKTGKKCICIKQ